MSLRAITTTVLMLAMSSFATSAIAAPLQLTGNTFVDMCESTSAEYTYCLGFMTGFVTGVSIQRHYADLKTKNMIYCWPAEATFGQATEIFAKYIKNHPEKRHESARFLASVALASAFPC